MANEIAHLVSFDDDHDGTPATITDGAGLVGIETLLAMSVGDHTKAMSIEQIAAHEGISRQFVHRIYTRAIRKAERALRREGITSMKQVL